MVRKITIRLRRKFQIKAAEYLSQFSTQLCHLEITTIVSNHFLKLSAEALLNFSACGKESTHFFIANFQLYYV